MKVSNDELEAIRLHEQGFECVRRGNQTAGIPLLNAAIVKLRRLVLQEGCGHLANKLAHAYSSEATLLFSSDAKKKSYDQAIEDLDRLVIADGRRDLAHWYIGALANKARLVAELGELNRENQSYFADCVGEFQRLHERARLVCDSYLPIRPSDGAVPNCYFIGRWHVDRALGERALGLTEAATAHAKIAISALKDFEKTGFPDAQGCVASALAELGELVTR